MTSSTARRAAFAATLLLSPALARPASAYVRVTTTDGRPYLWAESCVFITPSARPSPDLAPDAIAAAAWAAALSWSRQTVPCTYLELEVTKPASTAGTVRADGVNSLVFRQDRWCRETPSSDGTTTCYDPAALALTSFFARESDARIFDADVEVNGVNWRWGILDGPDDPAARSTQDLPNTLTHEFGHVIGLDHNCYAQGSTRPRGKDQNGEDAVDCKGAPPEIRESTMYYSASTGDISKRTLADDDVAAVCAGYPVDRDPRACRPAELPGGGCGVGGAAGATSLAWVAVALSCWLVRRARFRT